MLPLGAVAGQLSRTFDVTLLPANQVAPPLYVHHPVQHSSHIWAHCYICRLLPAIGIIFACCLRRYECRRRNNTSVTMDVQLYVYDLSNVSRMLAASSWRLVFT